MKVKRSIRAVYVLAACAWIYQCRDKLLSVLSKAAFCSLQRSAFDDGLEHEKVKVWAAIGNHNVRILTHKGLAEACGDEMLYRPFQPIDLAFWV